MTERDTTYRLAAETGLDARTVDRALRGEGARRSTVRAVQTAARKLRIALPAEQALRTAPVGPGRTGA